jgi:hypothetical protein
VLQVWLYHLIALLRKATVLLVSRIYRLVRHCLEYMDITRRIRWRPWEGWRSNGESSDIEQVWTFSPRFLVLIHLSTGAPSICFFLLLRWQCSFQSFISSWLAYSLKSLCTSPWFLRFYSICIPFLLSVFRGGLLSLTFPSGICVYYWITKYYCGFIPMVKGDQRLIMIMICGIAGAIIFTIIALLSIISYFGFRSRIPLASLLLQVVMDVTKHHTSVYAVAFTALFLQAGLAVWGSHLLLHGLLIFKSHTQMVYIYCYSDVSLLFFVPYIMIWNGNSYAKWTPGNPCMFDKLLHQTYYSIFL